MAFMQHSIDDADRPHGATIIRRGSPNVPGAIKLEYDEPTENQSQHLPVDVGVAQGPHAKPRRRVPSGFVVGAFFVIAFIVLPLLKVTLFGGSNIHSRIARWNALRISIQSVDPGRIAVDDRDAEIKLLTDFLYPFDTAPLRASTFYDTWRSQSEWSIRLAELKPVEFSEDRRTVVSTTFMRMQNVFEIREFYLTGSWLKHDGIWYLETEKLFLLDAYTSPPQRMYRPEQPIEVQPETTLP